MLSELFRMLHFEAFQRSLANFPLNGPTYFFFQGFFFLLKNVRGTKSFTNK